MLYYNKDTENLYSAHLNGLNSTVVINIANVKDFAYDGERGVLYYLHERTLRINSVNISSGQDIEVQALSSFTSITSMEIDIKNG